MFTNFLASLISCSHRLRCLLAGLFIVLSALSPTSLASEFNHGSTSIVTINKDISMVETAPNTSYFVENGPALNIHQITDLNETAWAKLPDNVANFGFSDKVHWFRFTLRNSGDQPLELYVHLDYALLDKIDFYGLDNSTLSEVYHAGDLLAYKDRPVDFPTFLFPVEIAAKQDKNVYVRVDTKGTVQVPMTVWQREAFLLEKQHYLFLYGCFLSIILLMSAYNFCLYIFVRDKSYLYYTLFTFCMAGIHASLDGLAYQWVWPNAPAWHQISAVTLISLGLIATVLFTKALLPIPDKGFISTGVKALLILTLSSALISLFIPYRQAAILNGTATMLTMSGVMIVCIAMLKHSPRIARFYTSAWAVYFFGILLKSSSKMGVLPYSMFTEYAGNLGGICGVVILSLALADRINSERRDKVKAQQQSIGNLKRFQMLYENALEGIFAFDQKGLLVSANPAFLKLMSVPDVETFNESNREGFKLPHKQFKSLLKEVKENQHTVDFETQMVDHNGEELWVNISARLNNESEHSGTTLEGTLININERKAFEQQLKHLAEHDPLTGFYNRRAFETAANQKLEEVQNYQTNCCMMYLDLDQFKIVNDLCGHTAGDLLLKNLSKRLLNLAKGLNKDHLIARLGGDEFGVLLSNTKLEKARLIAEQFRKSVDEFLFVWQGNRYTLGVSIGLVELCPFHHTVEQILVMADSACYQAKDQGRNRVHTFVETDKDLQFRQLEMQWVSTIKDAITHNRFFLVFQHIANNHHSEEKYHYEILLRLLNKNGNLCAPNQFIPAAERYNLMTNVDRWVISHYFQWLNEHPEHMAALSCASINLSTHSLGDETFSNFLIGAFKEYSIPPNKICFEITESMAITHIDNTQTFIQRFRNLGCRFALDDFGTGFSSYAYLKELSLDYIKIDGIFIKNLTEDSVDHAMVKSICDVAKAIGIETVAEFVENEEIQTRLRDIGINYSQGYHIHKPVRLDSQAFTTKMRG